MIRITKERDNLYIFPRGEAIPPGKIHIGHSIKKERKKIKDIIERELEDVLDELPSNIKIL